MLKKKEMKFPSWQGLEYVVCIPFKGVRSLMQKEKVLI